MLESGLTDDKLAVFIENSVIFAVMEYTGGNQVKAAKVLGWSRGTLRTKLTSYFGTTQLGGVFQRSLKKFRKRKQVIDNLCVRED
ncbi:MAG: hypothetical protein HRT87_04115 [Legionellales bacterium]|nr:hypothetical protein [Legionellales bacterium]